MIREAIAKVVEGADLTVEEAAAAMEDIMVGEATPAQIGAFITALRMKGETIEEIAGMARTMRAHATPVRVAGPLLDTCGTGGDGSGSFNISTAAAFVAAAAGVKVAKHGNRAASSRSGSADVLEALGVRIELTPAQVERCLETVGIGFMFAPAFHPAMRFAAGPRREIGIRTVFNILGPLTNPAGAEAQLLGVASVELAAKMAAVLQLLGSRRALVVHGADGMDELTLCAESNVWEVRSSADHVTVYAVRPETLGLRRVAPGALRGGSPTENAITMRDILGGTTGPLRDVVVLNAAAALLAAEAVANLPEGVAMAQRVLDSGAALHKLDELVAMTQGFD